MSDLTLLGPVFENSQTVAIPQIITLKLDGKSDDKTLTYELGMQLQKSSSVCKYYSELTQSTDYLVSPSVTGLGLSPFQDFELRAGHFIPVKDCDPKVFHIGANQNEELSKYPVKYWILVPFNYTPVFYKLNCSNVEGRDFIPSAFVRFSKDKQDPVGFGIDCDKTTIGLNKNTSVSSGPLGTLTDNFYFCFEVRGEGYIFALYKGKFYCGQSIQVKTELKAVFAEEVRLDQIIKAKEFLSNY